VRSWGKQRFLRAKKYRHFLGKRAISTGAIDRFAKNNDSHRITEQNADSSCVDMYATRPFKACQGLSSFPCAILGQSREKGADEPIARSRDVIVELDRFLCQISRLHGSVDPCIITIVCIIDRECQFRVIRRVTRVSTQSYVTEVARGNFSSSSFRSARGFSCAFACVCVCFLFYFLQLRFT